MQSRFTKYASGTHQLLNCFFPKDIYGTIFWYSQIEGYKMQDWMYSYMYEYKYK